MGGMQPTTGETPSIGGEMKVIGAVSEHFKEDITSQAAPQWYQDRGWRVLDVEWPDPPEDKVRGESWLVEPLWGEVRVQSPSGEVWEIVFTADPPEGGWTKGGYVPEQARPVEIRPPSGEVDPKLDVPAALRALP